MNVVKRLHIDCAKPFNNSAKAINKLTRKERDATVAMNTHPKDADKIMAKVHKVIDESKYLRRLDRTIVSCIKNQDFVQAQAVGAILEMEERKVICNK